MGHRRGWYPGRRRARGVHSNELPEPEDGARRVLSGAAVMGFVTSAAVPDGVDPATVPKPLSPEIARHVARVVLYGMPNARAMNVLGEPPVVIGPTYAAKAIEVCVPEDLCAQTG